MNQLKKTTAKLNQTVAKESDRTWELGQRPSIDLSLEMTDAGALRTFSNLDDRPQETPERTEKKRRSVDGKTNRARSPVVSSAFLKWLLARLSRSKGGLAAFTLAAVWGWWNSQLLLSTGLGIAAMMLVYRGQSGEWQLLRSKAEEFWEGPNRRLVLAVGAGGIATLGAYMSLAIWADSDSHWVALSLILQNFGTIAMAGLLLRQALSVGASKDEAALDRILGDLTDADPVKRLIAVRQMTDLMNRGGFNRVTSVKSWSARSLAAECFRLMLSQEPEALVRNALLEGLQTWDDTYGIVLETKNKVIDY
ncbi:MAG: hypothetical protein JGK17_10580 [Microcoleus sp. PH2017_10_PVI_O_A]|uniref:hypothetical protein n=1 Tax=unclassified Microcoleus TaxID=2642155 RepID=UPI001D56228C|nr:MULTISPECIES: hypothetical protein [unclassified Microcoleus]TAE74646.1 MAG: hypothetical protein EAZ83_30165 [Oscillatoriales cyanobacterium]MCC3406019.1 hypothetical protein [Microcoleus sp. PH2017_10_PVI_O_A]MCC3463936.1 hypothetical protein [Microcoleus sp. PH2017_11_PCY_U_A]MCC3482262.1 hypothetical protein [Microcoleus sp. PH2017_12_PCY_D_A]MCC3532120.1 hypothetical protein [Microcoleus sp. PH2017_21_RUC_O_A]